MIDDARIIENKKKTEKEISKIERLKDITGPIESFLEKPAEIYRLWSGSGGFRALRMKSIEWPLDINPYRLEKHFQTENGMTHYFSMPISSEKSDDKLSEKQVRLGLFKNGNFSDAFYSVYFFTLDVKLGPKFETPGHNDYDFKTQFLVDEAQLKKINFCKKEEYNNVGEKFVSEFLKSLDSYSKTHF